MADNKLTLRQRITNFLTFVWNSETHELLGRSGRSWGEITLFYIIYYACLAGFFAACMTVFNTTLDDKFPRLQGTSSLLRANPGMGFKPMPDLATTLIRFDHDVAKTYDPYVKHIDDYLKSHHLNASSDMHSCDGINSTRPDADQPCSVDLNATLTTCGEKYGFSKGQPCILLKLNKIFDWIPEPYDVNDLPENMPQSLKDKYDDTKVWISCEGENPGDNDNIGPVEYLPTQGFDLRYFPYKNQKNYLQPLIFLRLPKITRHVGMLIECKAWAKNIWHDRTEKQGSIHFELIID